MINIERVIFIFNNYIFKYVYIYVGVVALLLILFSTLLFGKRKVERINRLNKKKLLSRLLTFPIVFFSKLLMPKSESRKSKIISNFSRLGINISLERFYIVKVVIPLVVSLLLGIVYFTNTEYEIMELLNTSSKVTKSIDINNAIEFLDNEENAFDNMNTYKAYKIIKNNYKGYRDVENNKRNDIYDMNSRELIVDDFQEIISEKMQIGEDEGRRIGEYILSNIEEIRSIKIISPINYIFIVSSIFIPDLIIVFMNMFQRRRYKNDVEILKITTLILGSIEGVTSKKLLESLRDVSYAYRYVFMNALNNINSIQVGKEDVIMDMAEEVELPQFRKLCGILKEISNGNKKVAISNLESDMILEDKEDEMISNDRIEKKTWIAILIISPSMLFLMMLLLLPFARYYQSLQL